MKKILIAFLLLGGGIFFCQESPKTFVTVVDSVYYVNWEEPGNNFSIAFPGLSELKPLDDMTQNRLRAFTGDGYIFEVLSIPVDQVSDGEKDLDSICIKYIDSETEYLGGVMNVKNLRSYIEKIEIDDQSSDVRFYFWGFKHPPETVEEDRQDSTKIYRSVKESIFAITLANNYITGISTPVFKEDEYDGLRDYIIQNIIGISRK